MTHFARRACAVFALAALPLVAEAQTPAVALSLNLRYHDPADPSEGGRWFLVGKTSDHPAILGIGALDVYLANIATTDVVFGNNGVAGFKYPAVNASTLGAVVSTPDGGPFAGLVGGTAHIVYRQGDFPASPVLGVGKGSGTPGNVADDPLKNATLWNDAALIASGTFPGRSGSTTLLPTFATPEGNMSTAGVISSTADSPTGLVTTPAATTRRGDSLGTLGLNTTLNSGLLRGDVTRDFRVNSDDLNFVLLNFNTIDKSWDEGDVTDGLAGHIEGRVDSNDLSEVLIRFNTNSLTPAPATQAAPEPTSLAVVASLLLVLRATPNVRTAAGIARRSWLR